MSQQRYLEDLEVGMTETFSKVVSGADIEGFADITGDRNPLHLDEEYAATTQFKGRIAHGMLSASYISTILGTRLPGPGTIYMGQTLQFRAPVRIGDEVVARCTISQIIREKGRVILNCVCLCGDTKVVTGEATVFFPSRDSV